MGNIFFRRKPPMNSDEYEKLAKRVTDLESTLDGFVAKFMSLRGLIHRKGFAPEPEESKDPKNINTDMLLADDKVILDGTF